MQSEAHYDVVVIGGGPAGLAGGLWLARYQRRTLIVDAEEPRNAVTTAIHGYLGLQDIPPDVLARLLNAAHQAPSVGFSQPWDFIVITDRDKRQLAPIHERLSRAGV